jgi:hypothetical protein
MANEIAWLYERLSLKTRQENRFYLALNASAGPELLEHLARAEGFGTEKVVDRVLIRSVATNPRTSPAFLAEMLEDDDRAWWTSVAQNPALPAELFERIFLERKDEASQLFYLSPIVEDLGMSALRRDGLVVGYAMAHNKTATGRLLKTAWGMRDRQDGLERKTGGIRSKFRRRFAVNIAKHPNTPADVLAELAVDPRYHVRKAIEERP